MIDQQAGTSTGTVSVRSTGTRATRALGIVCLAGTALLVFLGLVGTPDDEVQGDAVRILYIHVPAAWVAYLAFGVTALVQRALPLEAHPLAHVGSLRRRFGRDRRALHRAHPGDRHDLGPHLTWGVYWTWDARLTTTALLFVLFLGYLAAAPHACEPRGTSEAQRHRSGSSPSSTCRSCTSRSSGGARCTRTRRCSAVTSSADRGHHALHPVPRHRRVHAHLRVAAGAPFRIAVTGRALDEHGLELALAERRAEAAWRRRHDDAMRAGDPRRATSSCSAASRSTRSGSSRAAASLAKQLPAEDKPWT